MCFPPQCCKVCAVPNVWKRFNVTSGATNVYFAKFVIYKISKLLPYGYVSNSTSAVTLRDPEFLKQSSVIYVILLRNEKLGNDNTANFVMIFIYSLPVQSTKICLRRIGWCPHKPVRKQNVCG